MTDATTTPPVIGMVTETRTEPGRRYSDWPLMGDIVSHRAGVPEHLIRWRRAQGEGDPEPML